MTPQARHRLGLTAGRVAEHDQPVVLRQFEWPVDGESGGPAPTEAFKRGLAVVGRELGDDDEDGVLGQVVEVRREWAVSSPDDRSGPAEEGVRLTPGQRPQRPRRVIRDHGGAHLGRFREALQRAPDAPAAGDDEAALPERLAQGVQAQGARAGRQRSLGEEAADRFERARGHSALTALGGAKELEACPPPDGGSQSIHGRQGRSLVLGQVERGEQRRVSRQDVLETVRRDDLDVAEVVRRAVAGEQGRVDTDPPCLSFHVYESWRPWAENLSGGHGMRLRDVGEWGLIERLRAFAGSGGLDFTDDCAFLPPMGPGMLVSSDVMVAGVHFDPSFMAWRDIGFRALAGALSDLAASGASDAARYTVSIGLPEEFELEDALEIYEGMRAVGKACDAQLAGGDTVASPTVFIAVSVFAATRRPLLRSNAQPGERLYCSGTLGAAARGLELARVGGQGPALERFLRPLPRMRLGRLLSDLGAGACVDVSDGLFPELKAMADASRVGIELDEDALPLVDDIPRSLALRYAYGGGEDYELVFSGPDDLLQRLPGRDADLPPCTAIGRIREHGAGLTVRRAGALEPMAPAGYSHFSGGGQ